MDDDRIVETTTEARGASSGYNKWVLLASTALIIVAFAVIVAIGWR